MKNSKEERSRWWNDKRGDDRSYSPLRNLRENGKIYIDGQQYNTHRNQRSFTNDRDNIYNDYTEEAKRLSSPQQQALDLFLDYANSENKFKGIDFVNNIDNNPNVLGKFDYPNHKLYLNKIPFLQQHSSKPEISLHELTHLVGNYKGKEIIPGNPLTNIIASEKPLINSLKPMVYKEADDINSFNLEQLDLNAPPVPIPKADFTKMDKILSNAQNIIDPIGNFSSGYKPSQFIMSDFELDRPNQALEEVLYKLDEFPAHFMPRFDKKITPSEDEDANIFTNSVIDYSKKALADIASKNYPDINSNLKQRQKEIMLKPQLHLGFPQPQQRDSRLLSPPSNASFDDLMNMDISPSVQNLPFGNGSQFSPSLSSFSSDFQYPSPIVPQPVQKQQKFDPFEEFKNSLPSLPFNKISQPSPPPSNPTRQNLPQQHLPQNSDPFSTFNDIMPWNKKKAGGHIKSYANGGYVSSNDSYNPYLNTYNYEAPLRLSEYLTDQMPDSGYDETAGYNDPYMSYGNAYDDDGQQYSFREGGSVETGNPNFPRLLDVIGEEEPVRGDIVNKAKELSQMVINEVLNANNGKLDEPTLINKFTEIGNSLNLNEAEKNQVERFVENIFKNSQFNDSPGYFYEKAHGMTNNMPTQSSFKRGGTVDIDRGELPRLADLISRYGRNGDTELAHINPIEAHILKSLGGSGTINPKTGLREYGMMPWHRKFNPVKAITSSLGGGAGAIIGNMIAPGIGGIIGGALGQGAQHAARGKSALSGALKGAGMGAALPSVASGLGWGASRLGATALGSSLSNYGSTNAILPALGMGSSSGSSGLFGLGGSNPYVSGGLSAATALSSGMGTGRGQGLGVSSGDYAENYYNYMLDRQKKQDNMGFTDKLQDYLTQPGNLLTLGTTAAQYLGREKPKSPEKIAEEERRYRNASRKTIAEVEADEALEIARKDLKKKHKNKQLEEDIKNMGSVKRHVVSPEEFARTGRWLEYEDDEGRPVRMKGGGSAHSPYTYLTEETYYPASPLHYLNGDSGGQDDLIDAKLSDGEYVIDAATVADLGDGNNAAGARKLDNFRRNIREHKRGGKITLPPRSKSLESYLRG